jgi:hypothetical protein
MRRSAGPHPVASWSKSSSRGPALHLQAHTSAPCTRGLVSLIAVPILAALGAFGGSWLQRLGSKESETWQNLRDLDHRIHSSVDPYERQSCAEHVRELLRIGKLTATQRAYARTSAAVYEARLRDET